MTSKSIDVNSSINVPYDIETNIKLSFIARISEEDLNSIFDATFKNCKIIDLNSSKDKD